MFSLILTYFRSTEPFFFRRRRHTQIFRYCVVDENVFRTFVWGVDDLCREGRKVFSLRVASINAALEDEV